MTALDHKQSAQPILSDGNLRPDIRRTEIGSGVVRLLDDVLHLTNAPTADNAYSDAQISDYEGPNFTWRPPLKMTVTARALTANIRGTAGFGFWNQPFMPGQFRLRLPQATWFFFGSPPNNMQLAQGVPGYGWKAATLNAQRWQFLALAPTAPLGILLMRIPALYDRLWSIGQRAIGVSEALLSPDLLMDWHTYTLDWQTNGISFVVDGSIVHESPFSPGGPLGFVAWIDNQYAIVTPQGQFRFGLLPLVAQQTLQLKSVRIET